MAVRTTSGLPSITEFMALASRPATWVDQLERRGSHLLPVVRSLGVPLVAHSRVPPSAR